MLRGKGPELEFVPYGRLTLFMARIEDILQEDVVMVSCDSILPCDEPAYCYVRTP
jgi:hypothetical protein